MARLMIAIALMAVLAGLAIGATSMLGRAARSGQARLATVQIGSGPMQRISGILLVALILYVSVWGGA